MTTATISTPTNPHDLSQGSIIGHLIRLAGPMMIGILSIMAMYLVDTYFIGQLGKNPLAAMGFIFPVINLLNGIAFGIGAGASSVIARAIGSKDTDRVKQLTTQSLLLALSLAVAFAIGGFFTIEPLFLALGAPAPLLPIIFDYMSIWFLGCFLVVIPMVGNSAIRAAGNSLTPSVVMVSVAIVNMILDPIFIFGLFGVPAMGVQGAAIATITAYSVSFFIAIYVLVFRLNMIAWQHCIAKVMDGWREILKIGIPSIGNNLIAPLSILIATWFVSQHGIAAVAGFNVAVRIETFSIIPLMAVASIMGPFMGQNLGAQKPERMRSAILYAYCSAFGWGLFVAILLWFIREPIARLFSNEANVLQTTAQYLLIIPWSYGLLGITMATAASATGMGSAIPALMLTLVRLLILYLPLALVGSSLFGVIGIFSANFTANTITGLVAMIWLKRAFEQKCQSVDGKT